MVPLMSINYTVIFSRDPINHHFSFFFQDFHIMNSVLIVQWNSQEDMIMDPWGHILACVLQLHYV